MQNSGIFVSEIKTSVRYRARRKKLEYSGCLFTDLLEPPEPDDRPIHLSIATAG